ncbi:acyl-CoA dehydrogenase domain-containing protein [Diplocarpon rosae]|nr:acyl-CoA dehydrogenase domain-containing protein [Diplocarpon rosae]
MDYKWCLVRLLRDRCQDRYDIMPNPCLSRYSWARLLALAQLRPASAKIFRPRTTEPILIISIDKGLSVVLIERGEGVGTSAIKTSYSPAAGTAYVTFDNVKVPVENLLGFKNEGIHVILSNFNHERWMIACAVIRSSRMVTEECMK